MSDATVTLGAVGDLTFSAGIAVDMEAHGFDWPFARMRADLDRADILFGNLESVVIPDTFPPERLDPLGLVARLDSRALAGTLRRAGFDVLNLAQNHVLDAGEVGMLHTRRVLEEAGLAVGGVGATQAEARSLITRECGGLRFGFLCYCEDSNYTLGTIGPCHAYYTPKGVLEDIERHRPYVDILVVSVHADLEFVPTPSTPRLRAFRSFAAAGADIVLGHHPHVPQGCELVQGRLLAYSLGNFITAAREKSGYMAPHLPWTARSFLLLVRVNRNGVQSFERIPFEIGNPPEQRPLPLSGTAREELATRFAELDGYLGDDSLVQAVWQDAAKRCLAAYILQSLGPPARSGPLWKDGLHQLLWRLGRRSVGVDMDRVINDLVPRVYLTAENRGWMEEILSMSRQRWEARKSETPDPFRRPAARTDQKR